MRTRGISSTRIVGVVVVIALVAGLGLYLLVLAGPPSTSTGGTGVTSTNSGGPFNATAAYLGHLQAFANKTICSFSQCKYSLVALNDYTDKSTIIWGGDSGGLNGNYTGLQKIQYLYQAMNAVAQVINITTYNLKATGNQVNLEMNVTGVSTAIGQFNGTVKAVVTYASTNGAWSISKENWNYLSFNDQRPGGDTTFPQWRTIGGPISDTKSPDPFKQFIFDYGGGAMMLLIFSFVATFAVLLALRNRRA